MTRGAWVVLVLLCCVGLARGQTARGVAETRVGGNRVSIDYGRPELNGRDVLEALPPGMLWRMGMNRATTLTTEAELSFDDVEIPPGTYSLYLRRVNESTFHLLVNEETGQWGTQYDPERDIAAIPLELVRLDDVVETFEIVLETEDATGSLRLMWGDVALRARFETKPAGKD